MRNVNIDVEESRVAAHAAPRDLEDRFKPVPEAPGDGLRQLRPFSRNRAFSVLAIMAFLVPALATPSIAAVQSSWSGAFSGSLTRAYNGAGLVESVSDGSRERRMAYDVWKGAPRDESLVVGGGTWKTVSHQTDDAGNLVGMVDPEAVSHGWPVDENNRVLEKRYGSDAVVSFTYTPGGLPDQAFIKDATGVIVATTTHYYDGLGRKVRSQTVMAGTREVLADYVWEYNPAGEIVKEAPWHLGAVFEDGRDARGRLTFQATPGNNGGSTPPPFENTIVGMPQGNQADPSLEAQGTPKKVLPVPARIAGYTLDPLGNRMFMQVDGVGTTLTYDAASRLISEISTNGKSVTHEYDDWGQEIRKTTIQDGFATATEAYGYDYLGRMSAYANSATGATWQYDYWPNGDRYAKTNLSTQWKELYVPILGQVVADYTQAGSDEIQHQASYAQGEGSKAARISSGGARAHYVPGLGGSFDLTLGDEGAVLAEAVHDSFGENMGGDSIGPYGFAQMRSDSESGLWTSANGGLYDASTGRVFDSAEDYGDWIDTQERVTGYRRIAWLQGRLQEAESDWAAQFVYRATGGLVDAGLISLRWELAKEKGNQERVKAGCQDVMSGWSGMVFRGAGEISFANPIARILTGRSVTDPEVQVEAVDRWNEAALVLVTFGLMRWSNALRAELSAPRAISLEVEGAAQLIRHERALAMHARAHAAARAEMRVAAQTERYASPGMFRGEAARLQAESAARHGFTDATAATRSAVGMAQNADMAGPAGKLYRGVPSSTPRGQLARQGIVEPRGTSTDYIAHVTDEHVATDVTSWSRDPRVARQFGDIILEVEESAVRHRIIPHPLPGFKLAEMEVLIRGRLTGLARYR